MTLASSPSCNYNLTKEQLSKRLTSKKKLPLKSKVRIDRILNIQRKHLQKIKVKPSMRLFECIT